MFTGFDIPQENWSKLPHALIENLPLIETVSEMKVILYVLRHTWGYQDEQKKITLDEFESGRKKRDGSRIDSGTGLSKPSIIDGISRAVAHGFICVETDERDAARVKKYYSLQMSKDFTPYVKTFDTCGKESLHRSEKETPERNQEKDCAPQSGADIESTKPRKKSQRATILEELEKAFAEVSKIPPPRRNTAKDKRAAGELWWSPLWRLYELSSDAAQTKLLISEAIRKMRHDGLTIRAPKSIEGVAVSIYSARIQSSVSTGKVYQ